MKELENTRACYTKGTSLCNIWSNRAKVPFTVWITILLCIVVLPVSGQEETDAMDAEDFDPTDLSFEDLMGVEVTSASKKPQSIAKAATAIHVISSEEIRRSGATTIPDVLRLTPGFFVGKADSKNYAVAGRGLANVTTNKLLVLVDGRSVYSPTFSGVFWDTLDVMLEDVERIEVIRGPGATLWGSNAVNGVINIITKSAIDTQGTLVTGGGGTVERGFFSTRYGFPIGEKINARIYTKYTDHNNLEALLNQPIVDGFQRWLGGGRLDWNYSDMGSFTVQGDAYHNRQNQFWQQPITTAPYFQNLNQPGVMSGGNFLSRWKHAFSDENDLTIQFYFDRAKRDQSIYTQTLDTYDIDAQHRFQLTDRQELIWGGGARLFYDRWTSTSILTSVNTPRANHALYNIFVQDEVSIIDDRLSIVLGSKLEHNDFTGYEFQPSGRLLWTPNERYTLWTSVSKAVRTPGRAEADAVVNQRIVAPVPAGPFFPGIPPTLVQIIGNPGYEAEELVAYEFGFRSQLSEKSSLDLSLFYNVYEDLRTVEAVGAPDSSQLPAYAIQNFTFGNNRAGNIYGTELSLTLDLNDWWRLRPSYSLSVADTHAGPANVSTATADGAYPNQQVGLFSLMDLPGNLHLDLYGRWIDQVEILEVETAIDPFNPPGILEFPSYFSLDARLAWNPFGNRNVELAIVGQNLVDNTHPEYGWEVFTPQIAEVPRSAYVKLTVSF